MATVIQSFGLSGVDAYPVIVETVTLHGQPSVNIVGMGDMAVKEAAHRLEASLTYGSFARVGKGLRSSSSGVVFSSHRGLVLPEYCRTP